MGVNILEVKLGKLRLKSPIIMASGTFGFGMEKIEFVDYTKIGAITTKTITYEERKGNPQPRIWEIKCGMINRIGLQNPGVKYFSENILPELKKKKVKIIVSVSGKNEEEILRTFEILTEKNIKTFELNLSCPNIDEEKMISQNADLTYRIVEKVKKNFDITLIVKLSPNVTDITEIAIAAEKAGADILSMINTVKGIAIDTERMKIIEGGISGPVIKNIGLYAIYSVFKKVKIPLIGIGGITEGKDAVEYFLAGANAIEIGSGFFSNPFLIDEVYKYLLNYLRKNSYKNVSEITGLLNEKESKKRRKKTTG